MKTVKTRATSSSLRRNKLLQKKLYADMWLLLCVPVTVSRCKELDLPHQVSDNTSVLGTPFTVTIDKLKVALYACIECFPLRLQEQGRQERDLQW